MRSVQIMVYMYLYFLSKMLNSIYNKRQTSYEKHALNAINKAIRKVENKRRKLENRIRENPFISRHAIYVGPRCMPHLYKSELGTWGQITGTDTLGGDSVVRGWSNPYKEVWLEKRGLPPLNSGIVPSRDAFVKLRLDSLEPEENTKVDLILGLLKAIRYDL